MKECFVSRFGSTYLDEKPSTGGDSASGDDCHEGSKPEDSIGQWLFELEEHLWDTTAVLQSLVLWPLFGSKTSQDHSREMKRMVLQALQEGHIEAAKRLIQRNIRFSLLTRRFDDPVTHQLMTQLKYLNNVSGDSGC